MIDPALLLVDAATILTHHGWIQNQMYDTLSGAYCAYGALDRAATLRGNTALGAEFDDAYNLFVDYLRAHDATLVRYANETTIGNWNDAGERTGEEVIASLLDAAEQLGGVAA